MTIQHPLSTDGLAVLALTARSARGVPRGPGPDGPKPMGPRDVARVRRALAAAGATPGDLLGRDGAELAGLLGGATRTAEAIARLAARATTLALEVERLAERGIWLVSIADVAYPTRLRDRLGDSAPPILYGAGAVELLGAGGVAIVGSRDADAAALRYAASAAVAVARAGGTVVSGGARGVDRTAMNAAAKADGKVVGVLAESLERKARSAGIRALVADERLVLVSPYGADVPFSVGGAMGRNRLIYCLADAALIVSTADGTGGTWAGATEALEAGWVPVYVRTGDGVPVGNVALVSRDAVALEGDPELVADLLTALPEPTAWPPGPPRPVSTETGERPPRVQVAEQQTLFGGDQEADPARSQSPRARRASKAPS